jgi:predicted MFS family arabinose efflux permease
VKTSALDSRSLRTLLIGQGVSALGDWMGTFAFIALVYQQSGSSTAVGGVLALRLLPAVLGGPLAARAASRWPQRTTMIAMDVARAVMIALVPLVRGVWWIYLWGFTVEVGSLVFLPARDALIPELVDDRDLEQANSLVLGSSYGMIPVGAALYALIAALPGNEILGRPLALIFLLDAASFGVSALMIARISPTIGRANRGRAAEPVAEIESNVRFRDAFRLPLVRAVMPATIAVALGLGALFSLGIEFVRSVLHTSNAEFGVLVALFGVGAAAGLVTLQRAQRLEPLRATRFGALALGTIVALFSLSPSIGFALVGAGAFGAAVAWTLASGMGAIQSELDGRDRILAFAAFHIVIRSGLALAAVAAGAAGQLVGAVRWPLVGLLEPSRLVLLCSGLVVALSAVMVRHRAARASPDAEVVLTGEQTGDGPLADGARSDPAKGVRCPSQS